MSNSGRRMVGRIDHHALRVALAVLVSLVLGGTVPAAGAADSAAAADERVRDEGGQKEGGQQEGVPRERVQAPPATSAAKSVPGQVPTPTTGQDEPDGGSQSVKPGINERFLDPEMDVDAFLQRFEVESREVYAARQRVLDVCRIEPGMRIADIGAGTGFYSRLFARAVGESGWVYAVDLSTQFARHINQQADTAGIDHLTTVLCTERSVRLPPDSVDRVFICDTYHHFEYPEQTLASIFQALKSGGQMIVIDFERIPGESREFILGHVRAGKDVFRQEIEAAGFVLEEEVEIAAFRENYLLRFKKP